MLFLLPLILQIQNNIENLYAEKQEFHSLLYSPHCNHQVPRQKSHDFVWCNFFTRPFVDENETVHIFPFVHVRELYLQGPSIKHQECESNFKHQSDGQKMFVKYIYIYMCVCIDIPNMARDMIY